MSSSRRLSVSKGSVMGVTDRLKALFSGRGRLNVKSRFELLREAISGTMSKVYMARDREHDRIVALRSSIRRRPPFSRAASQASTSCAKARSRCGLTIRTL